MSKSKIREYKNRIISELCNDEDIINALDLNDEEDADDLVWHRIYPHLWIPQTEELVRSYILVEVSVPERRSRYGSDNNPVYVHPVIIFYVLVHQEDMRMNLAGESGTRMDYLAELIENKYEGRKGFGLVRLQLKSNLANSLNTTYRYRELIFEAVDYDDGLCQG